MKVLTSLKTTALSVFAALTVALATVAIPTTTVAAAPSETEQSVEFIPITSIEHAEALADSVLQAAIVFTYEAESPELLAINLDMLFQAVTQANAGFADAIKLRDLLIVVGSNALAVKEDPYAVYEQLAPQVKALAGKYARSLT